MIAGVVITPGADFLVNSKCRPLDAICRPIAVAPCTSDIHTVWEGAIGERHGMILGHEAVGEIVEVGSLLSQIKSNYK